MKVIFKVKCYAIIKIMTIKQKYNKEPKTK